MGACGGRQKSGTVTLCGLGRQKSHEAPAEDPKESLEDAKTKYAHKIEDRGKNFAEDMFGCASAIIIRDMYFLSFASNERLDNYREEKREEIKENLSKARRLRKLRILIMVLLAIATFFTQSYFMYKIRTMVTPEKVVKIRLMYSEYEDIMYDDVYRLPSGWDRGMPSEIHQQRFQNLTEKIKDTVCDIPLSQPGFFEAVLLLWTITVLTDLQKQIVWWVCLLLNTETTWSLWGGMRTCFVDPKRGCWQVCRLPWFMKLILMFFVGVPHGCVSAAVAWLGCRWLATTTHFVDLLLNAVALEFIFHLKQLFFNSFVPYRSKQDVSITKMVPFLGNAKNPMFIGLQFLWENAASAKMKALRDKVDLKGQIGKFGDMSKFPAGLPAGMDMSQFADLSKLKELGGALDPMKLGKIDELGLVPAIGACGWFGAAMLFVFAYIYYLQDVLPVYQWDIRAACHIYLKSEWSIVAPVAANTTEMVVNATMG